VLEAVEQLLDSQPSSVTVDVRRLEVSDGDGADTLVRVHRRVQETGTTLNWLGLDSDRFHDVVPFNRVGRRAVLAGSMADADEQPAG
jgi:hypothetical protein